MKNIVVRTFAEGQDELNDVISSLDRQYVRQYGSLDTGDGVYLEFVGTCSKPFTQKELNSAVKKEVENLRDYSLRDIDEETLKEFLKA